MITIHLSVILTEEFRADSVMMLEAATCSDALQGLNQKYPGMASRLVEADGRFRENLSVFISGRRLPPRAHASVELTDGSDVWILHAISGG
ncbi:MoaD/ThiS family protein [Alicyclobacillus ferrooxydans]|uniref:Thiamine biosynthesis protein ThiS n=1 Tax=Alicyclobacillus ferrooxydans TaxID=471514 RepID=A0A0P9EJ16_9BACL|nr:MoaD/ThiS family protein [Alicyclobacillus ferrooxydans]KPV42884.1 hypothetical protein AN477_15225 [Alicyclobacillus ferrooxydans]